MQPGLIVMSDSLFHLAVVRRFVLPKRGQFIPNLELALYVTMFEVLQECNYLLSWPM